MLFSDSMQLLSENFQISLINSAQWCTFNRVHLADQPLPATGEKEYLLAGKYESWMWNVTPSTPMLLYGQIPDAFYASRRSLALFREDQFSEVVFAIKQQCFEETLAEQDGIQTILSCLSSGCTLPEFTDTLAHILNNPVIISDTAFRLLAYCDYGQKEDRMFTEYIEGGHFTSAFISASHRYHTAPYHYHTTHPNGTHVEICCKSGHYTLSGTVILGATHVADIMMSASCTAPSGLHFRLFPFIVNSLSILLQKTYHYSQTCSCTEEMLISEIISADNELSVSGALMRLNRLENSRFPTRMCLILLESGENRDHLKHKADLCNTLRWIFPDSFVVSTESELVLLYPLKENDNAAASSLRHTEKFSEFITQEKLNVCVSESFESPSLIWKNYHAVREALAYAHVLKTEESGSLFYASTYQNMGIWSPYSRKKQNYHHPAIERLDFYDQTNDTCLCETLYQYLIHDSSIRKTAEAMFCHKNTISYRIDKIQTLADIDLSDPIVKFSLLQSLFARRISNTVRRNI